MITAADVREVAMSLPRTEEHLIRDYIKFRVGKIVYASVSPAKVLRLKQRGKKTIGSEHENGRPARFGTGVSGGVCRAVLTGHGCVPRPRLRR